MANWSTLKAAVAQIIKTNNNQEITGANMQSVLNNIIDNVGENSTFAGIATPTTNPGAPDGNVFYLATQAGTYTNFGGAELEAGLNILLWNGSSWSATKVMTIAQELGYLRNNIISQNAISYANFCFIIRDFYISGKELSNTNKIGTKVERFCPNVFEKLRDIKSSDNETLQNYTTYVIKNNNDYIKYVYANFKSAASYITSSKYMRSGIYDENDNLIKSSIEDGSLAFSLPPRYTLVVAGNEWISEPIQISRPLIYTNKDKTFSILKDYSDIYLGIYPKLCRLFKSGFSNITSVDGYKVSIIWDEGDPGNYAYITQDSPFEINENYIYYWDIWNNGDYPITINIGMTRGVQDWSQGYLYEKRGITINPSEKFSFEVDKYFIISNCSNYDKVAKTYLHVILYGRTGVGDNFLNAGNIDVSMYYTKNDNYDAIVNSKNAENAGWLVGGFSKNAVFRDFKPTGDFTPNAISVIQVDYRTVKLVTNISSSIVGSSYRGIYWRIDYNSLEDLKGIWRLTNEYSDYTTCRITYKIQDWGPNTTDNMAINNPVGGGNITYYDIYNAIKNYKQNHIEDGKWTGVLETQGFLYLQFLSYNTEGTYEEFEDILTLDFIPSDSRVIASEFTESAEERILEISENGAQSMVVNWGDSLTAGAGSDSHRHQQEFLNSLADKGYSNLGLTATSNITYSIMMQKLLGNKYNVINCGVGGENTNTIAARQGSNVIFTDNSFTLPADTTAVQIGERTNGLNSSWGERVHPLLQGDGNSVNPCYVDGIECTLTWTGTNYADSNGKFTIQRVTAGDRAVTFSNKTPIILYGSKLSSKANISVLWCWQNSGGIGDDELIEKLDKMISHLKTDKYLLIGLHSGNASSRASQEAALASKYGDKYFNWREYVSSNALYDWGITPTTDDDLTETQKSGGVISDESAMAEGSLPMSFWRSYIDDQNNAQSNDKVHMTATAYGILGFKIIERFKVLGYID